MDIILRQVALDSTGLLQDVAIKAGRIVTITPCFIGTAKEEIIAAGKVLIPGLVEPHVHLEKALIKDRKPNRSGTLQEALSITAALKHTFTEADIFERAKTVLFWFVKQGVTQLRTHAEFDPKQGFTGLDVSLALKKEFAHLLDIQVCAFPQEGILKMPGTEAMMHEAFLKGAEVCGGIAYNDTDPKAHIDLVFELAKHYDKDLDFHQDFSDNADQMSIEYVAQKTIEMGYEGRVSVGHLTALAAQPSKAQSTSITRIKEAGISVMCLPATDLHLGGRKDAFNVRRTLTPVRALRDAGVNVCLGSNNIRNAFTPYNNCDPFSIAYLAIAACHLGGADDLPSVLPMITTNAAKALRLPCYGLKEGNVADMVLLDTVSYDDAVIDFPERLYVIKNGKITVTTEKKVQILGKNYF